MKKSIFMIILFVLLVISSFGIKRSFSSDKTLYYDASKKKITYYNINKNDLFDDFKDLIPGDIKEQDIKIKIVNNNKKTKLYAKIYYDTNKDIIDNFNVKLYKNSTEIIENNNMFKISDFNNEEEVYLTLKVEIPTSVGNEIENYEGNFKMVFYVEENGKYSEVPKTLDSTNIILNYSLFIISLLLLIVMFIKRKQNN